MHTTNNDILSKYDNLNSESELSPALLVSIRVSLSPPRDNEWEVKKEWIELNGFLLDPPSLLLSPVSFSSSRWTGAVLALVNPLVKNSMVKAKEI